MTGHNVHDNVTPARPTLGHTSQVTSEECHNNHTSDPRLPLPFPVNCVTLSPSLTSMLPINPGLRDILWPGCDHTKSGQILVIVTLLHCARARYEAQAQLFLL